MRHGVWSRLWSAIIEGRVYSASLWHATAHVNKTREFYYRKLLNQPYHGASQNPSIDVKGDAATTPQGLRLKAALSASLDQTRRLPDFVRAIEGMSGQKYRVLINDLVRNTPNAKYLEVGSWAGSTAVAALYNNKVRALCIDDWSLFGGPKDRFFENVDKVRSADIEFSFIEADFRSVDYDAIGTFNIYLFDGPHEEKDQYDGVMLATPALDDPCILIVDDWNWRAVRLGTFRALRDAGLSLTESVEVRTTHDDTHGPVQSDGSDWHNGYFLAALTRG
jgi:hypothetical protein